MKSDYKRTIALGFFDGVHLGHAALLNKAKQRAAETGTVPAVLSFDVHPDNLVFHVKVPLISDCAGREEIIHRCFGIQDVVFLHFDRKVMNMPWKEFADSVVHELNAAWVVVGHDFTFGSRGEGKAERLKEYLAEKGIGCDIIPPVRMNGKIISSTYIRTLIEQGEMEEAAKFLGHPHCVCDTVRAGFHIGESLSAPTINMHLAEDVLVPRFGVYAAKVTLADGEEYPAVTNVGVRPTFGEGNKVTVETHLLHFSGNLYGMPARVDFYKFLRPEMKFDSPEALAEQIHRDGLEAEQVLKNEKINSAEVKIDGV